MDKDTITTGPLSPYPGSVTYGSVDPVREAIKNERMECELIALRIMERHQGTDAGKVAAEIAAAIRARS